MDIDSDFDNERRQEVIDYTKRKYGEKSVCQVLTMMNMMSRAIIRDVGRALDYSATFVDVVAKSIPMEIGMTLPKAMEVSSKLRDLCESDERARKLVDIGMKLEGLPKSTSRHAAGVLIVDEKGLTEHIPILRNKDNDIVSQLDKRYLEALNLLKMDFLGLKTLGIIKRAIKRIKKNHNVNVDLKYLYTIPDPAPFSLMGDGQTDGIFQLESPGMTEFFMKLKPQNLDDVTLGIAMYRPGPMQYLGKILENRADPRKIKYAFSELKDILGVTSGILCYQEQCMRAVVAIAGYSKGDSDNFRSVVAKKKVKLMPLHKQWFIHGRKLEDVDEKGRIVKYKTEIPGGIALGHSQKDLEAFFNEMEEFAKYSFNKSHAAAYATIAYVTAWLSFYYPAEYFSAILDYSLGNPFSMSKYMAYIKKRGISVSDIDINYSEEYFNPISSSQIIYPLRCKNVKGPTVEAIVKERNERGKYSSLTDFLARNATKIDKSSFNSWANCGAFKDFGYTESSLTAATDDIFSKVLTPTIKKKVTEGTIGDTTLRERILLKLEEAIPKLNEFPLDIRLRLEREYMGHYLTGHPLDVYVKQIRDCMNCADTFPYINLKEFEYTVDDETGIIKTSSLLSDRKNLKFIAVVEEVRLVTTKKKEQMAILSVTDLTGSASVVVWPQTYQKFRDYMKEDMVYEIKGSADVSDDRPPQIILSDMSVVDIRQTSEKCIFYVDNKAEARKIVALLRKTKDAHGKEYTTYIQLGRISMLVPMQYRVKKSVLDAISKDKLNKYKYKVLM